MLLSSDGSFYAYPLHRWLPDVPFAHVRDWWQQTQAIQDGRSFARYEGALAAAMGLRYLNRHTEDGLHRQRDEVYRLKRALITLFYCQQFPVHVSRQQQTLRCDRCCGTGIFYSPRSGYEDDCWHCDGTGIYRQTSLLRFQFTIGGEVFVWHQPEDRVDPLIYIHKGEPGIFEGTKQAHTGFDWTTAHIALGAVVGYLQQHRDVQVRLPGLRSALMADFAPLRRRWDAWIDSVRKALVQAHYLSPRDQWLPF